LKSPGKDEPWHFVDPKDLDDNQLAIILSDHYKSLVESLKAEDKIRSAFEAAWLAHALVDGLTPAHHFPLEKEMNKLRGSSVLGAKTTVAKKLILPGGNIRRKIVNNWQVWGPKGIYTTHIMFETGFATMIAPMRFRKVKVNPEDIGELRGLGLKRWFGRQINVVVGMGLYESFSQHGWTIKLGRIARLQLAPLLVKDVTVIWYCAAFEAGLDLEK
jgi:hypothetical protein